MEMRGAVTDAGQTYERQTSEDRATQPIEAGGWVSQKPINRLWSETDG